MYYDDIKFINVLFSSLLTNLCEKVDFDGGPPEGPFSPDGSHILWSYMCSPLIYKAEFRIYSLFIAHFLPTSDRYTIGRIGLNQNV